MSVKKLKIVVNLDANKNKSITYLQENMVLNRIHYSDDVFKCIDKVYYNGALCHHYSYIENTNILDGEIIDYEKM